MSAHTDRVSQAPDDPFDSTEVPHTGPVSSLIVNGQRLT